MRTLRAGESRNRICRCRSGKRAYTELQCAKTHSMNIKTFRWLPAENLSQRAAYRAKGVQLCCALLRCVLTVVLGVKTSTGLRSTQKRIANYHTRYMWHAILSTSSSDVVHTCRAISFWTAIERRNEHGTCIGAKRPLLIASEMPLKKAGLTASLNYSCSFVMYLCEMCIVFIALTASNGPIRAR